MNDLVRIESVRNGTAEPSVAYEVAFKAISAAVFTIGEVDLSRINGIAVLSVIDCDVETQLHQKFKEFRRHGEWFDDSSGSILREFRSMEGRS